jgi:DNA topoisomerase VI subunit B
LNISKNNKNSVTDNNEIEIDLDEEWSEEDKKAYLKYLKETELKTLQ